MKKRPPQLYVGDIVETSGGGHFEVYWIDERGVWLRSGRTYLVQPFKPEWLTLVAR